MTREDTKTIIAMIITAYPYFGKRSTKEMALTIDLWASAFAGAPYEIIHLAIKRLIATSTFAPSIAEVRAMIGKMRGEATELLLMGNVDKLQGDKLRAIVDGCKAADSEPTLLALIEERRQSLEAHDISSVSLPTL